LFDSLLLQCGKERQGIFIFFKKIKIRLTIIKKKKKKKKRGKRSVYNKRNGKGREKERKR